MGFFSTSLGCDSSIATVAVGVTHQRGLSCPLVLARVRARFPSYTYNRNFTNKSTSVRITFAIGIEPFPLFSKLFIYVHSTFLLLLIYFFIFFVPLLRFSIFFRFLILFFFLSLFYSCFFHLFFSFISLPLF